LSAKEPMPGDPPAVAAVASEAKAKSGAEAKSVLLGIEVLVRRASSLLSVSESLREDARGQVGVLVDSQVGLVLGDRPITDLRNLTSKGSRLSALAGAGYRTVADVAGATSLQLQRVRGIGEQTALQVLSAVRRYTGEVRLETRIRFDPDRQDPGQTQLLATLAAVPRTS
jgi:helix-hairpin-helix protein